MTPPKLVVKTHVVRKVQIRKTVQQFEMKIDEEDEEARRGVEEPDLELLSRNAEERRRAAEEKENEDIRSSQDSSPDPSPLAGRGIRNSIN